jgi:hypothetical protein
MKNALVLAVIVTAALAGCQTAPQQAAESPATGAAAAAATPFDPVARGKYLTSIMGCNDCHTPMTGMGPEGPMYDSERFLAGHPAGLTLPPPPPAEGPWFMATNMTAFSGPWGVSYSANITPDSLTGLGIWTEEIFVKAMRTGRHMGVARPILPPMPWPSVAALTDEDLKSLYAYLRTVPAISNEVPQPVLAGPPPGAEGAGSH